MKEDISQAKTLEAEGEKRTPRFGVSMSELTARRAEIDGRLFREIVRLFREWANEGVSAIGVGLPSFESMRRAIALGQTFEWRETGTHFKLVIARDHLKYGTNEYGKVEFFLHICAEVNLSRNDQNKKAYEGASAKVHEFGLLIDDYLVKKGVAEKLRAYDFRKRGDR